ncbi:hypothetical protein Salat_2544500 [Sesamum alatum]|uniref:RNase H type-1 domain-containing protein n=1 Tax=Sesamum alatum TaxID=300844 RepID=A0AAE1XSD9_9LAMI|nr:hypothetical protein Salat_2544500 [Sesamum alatum]
MFVEAEVVDLPLIYSDHCPVLVLLKTKSVWCSRSEQGRFKFEACWTRSEDCAFTIVATWGISVPRVGILAKDYLLAFQTVNARGPPIVGRVVSKDRWIPPYSGNLAANLAGFVLPDGQGASAGVVIRDEYGECIDWKVAVWPHIFETDHAKALAARFAVEMAGNYEGQYIQFSEWVC